MLREIKTHEKNLNYMPLRKQMTVTLSFENRLRIDVRIMTDEDSATSLVYRLSKDFFY